MHTEAAIRHKLKQVKFRYLKKRLEVALEQCSGNCANNIQLKLRTGNLLGVCSHNEFKGSICDEAAYGNRARTCPKFQHLHTKEDTKAVFSTELAAMSLPDIAAQYPDMAALLWVLSEEVVVDEPEAAQYGMPDKSDFDSDYESAEPLSPVVQEAVDKYMLGHPVSPYEAPRQDQVDGHQAFLDSVLVQPVLPEGWHQPAWYTRAWLWVAKLNIFSTAL